jgi:hypothetical protein
VPPNQPIWPHPSLVEHQLKREQKLPKTIVLNDSPEMTSKLMFFQSQQHEVKLDFIQPGKATQNTCMRASLLAAATVI